MKSAKKFLLSTTIILAASVGAADAGTWTVDVWTGAPTATYGVIAEPAFSPFADTGVDTGVTAEFTYTGDLTFSDLVAHNATPNGDLVSTFLGENSINISNYTLTSANSTFNYPGFATPADFSTLAGYLAASQSSNQNMWTTTYLFTMTGPTPAQTLTVTHDDGVGVYVDGVYEGGKTGETTIKTQAIDVPASQNSLAIWYTADNGSPSVLEVSSVIDAPEPASLALLGTGLLGLGVVRRFRRRG